MDVLANARATIVDDGRACSVDVHQKLAVRQQLAILGSRDGHYSRYFLAVVKTRSWW
jgi:hypothetical protein